MTSPLPPTKVASASRALVLDGHVVDEEVLQVLDGLVLGLAELKLRSIGGHDVPLRAPRGERVGRDHLDALAQEVVPGLDVLRFPGRTAKTTTESVTIPLYCPLLQSVATMSASISRVMSGLEREGDDVRRQAGFDGAALLARRGVGLLEIDALACRGVLEGRDDLLVRLPRVE